MPPPVSVNKKPPDKAGGWRLRTIIWYSELIQYIHCPPTMMIGGVFMSPRTPDSEVLTPQHGNRHVALYFITDKNPAQAVYKIWYETTGD